ncbi:MAG: hypothetical protein KF768_01260 [Phycisphaeraceae bacterium]|nr:hypothetical protein [Phycisphaeraceae bacterium]
MTEHRDGKVEPAELLGEDSVDTSPPPTGPVGPARFPCCKCGGQLEFAPGVLSMRCPYCGTQNEIEPPTSDPNAPGAAVHERDLTATLAELESAAELVSHRTVKCGACAAEIERPEHVTSFSCPFCGTNIVATGIAARHIKPEGVLPFVYTRQRATETFRAWLKSRWFAPNALKREGLLDSGLSGVYMPAWTYDADTVTAYTGQRGDAYYVTVGSGKNRTTVRKVRWSRRSGVVRHEFDDVLVLASNSLPEKLAHELEPWDTGAALPYRDEYLAGFHAECYQIDVEGGFTLAQGKMRSYITTLVKRDIGGDEQRIASMDIDYRNVTFKHLLLPVWISAYRYRGKLYRFLVNARTGEVQGQRPYSWIKITLAVLAGLIVVGGFVAFLAGR